MGLRDILTGRHDATPRDPHRPLVAVAEDGAVEIAADLTLAEARALIAQLARRLWVVRQAVADAEPPAGGNGHGS